MLTTEQAKKLCQFIGYGDASAPLWFFGMKEGLGARLLEGEAEKNLVARASWATVMDMAAAHETLVESGCSQNLATRSSANFGVWRYMAYLAYRNETCPENMTRAQHLNDLVRTRLGRTGSETFLSELNPVPRATVCAADPIAGILSSTDREVLLNTRRTEILDLVEKYDPKVICYGLGKSKEYADFFGVEWSKEAETIYKSESGNIWLLPFFGNGQISYDILDQAVPLIFE